MASEKRVRKKAVWFEVACVVALFLAMYCAVGAAAAPGGPVFALEAIFLGGIAGGRVAEFFLKVATIPSLLWMLIIGLLLGNVPGLRVYCGDAVDKGSSSALRTAALSLIMARAGLGLDGEALYRLRYSALALALLPCLMEASLAGLLAFAFFQNFPPAWCATLGFVVAAVSPAVVVPSLLKLADEGYGLASGIPTLVVAAAALDDVFSLAGFGVSLGFAVEKQKNSDGVLLPNQLWADILRAPLEIFAGFAVAFFGAALLKKRRRTVTSLFFFSSRRREGKKASRRTTIDDDDEDEATIDDESDDDDFGDFVGLGALCLASTFGLKRLGLSGASALATLTLAFLGGRDFGKAKAKRIGSRFTSLWNDIGQPTLFALLGVAVDLSTLSAKTAGLAVGLLLIAGVARFGSATVAVRGRPLAERTFVALAWMPKATVQALVGAVPLDEATSQEDQRRGHIVLAVAVVAVLITAPLGAFAIAYSGPRLLKKQQIIIAPGDAKKNEVVIAMVATSSPENDVLVLPVRGTPNNDPAAHDDDAKDDDDDA